MTQIIVFVRVRIEWVGVWECWLYFAKIGESFSMKV